MNDSNLNDGIVQHELEFGVCVMVFGFGADIHVHVIAMY